MPLPRERVFAAVADLATYPRWSGIVLEARPDGAAWHVEIGGRLGPLRRTKRLRMARTQSDPPRQVRFERDEADGRDHSPWVLTVELSGETDVRVRLFYGGGFPLPGVDRLLEAEMAKAPGRLYKLLAD